MLIDVFLLEFENGNDKGTPKTRWPLYVSNNPYYVTGNAILHSKQVCEQLTLEQKNKIKVSHGIFVNIYPEYSKSYRNRKGQTIGKSLPDITTYHDLFTLREPLLPYDHEGGWISAPDYHISAVDGEKLVVQKRAFVTFYALGLDDPNVFEGIQLGGKRNMGFGETKIADHKTLEFEDLDFTPLTEKEDLWCELITPLCIESQYTCNTLPTAEKPKTYAGLPSFMDYSLARPYRIREEYIKEGTDKFNLKLIDHGQAFPYKGGKYKDDKEKIYTAKKGLEGLYNHGKYGYGEVMLR